MDVIKASKILRLILKWIVLLCYHKHFFFRKASFANIYLLFISSSLPSRLPRYFKIFQFWFDYLLFVEYSLVFFSGSKSSFWSIRAFILLVYFHIFFCIYIGCYPRYVFSILLVYWVFLLVFAYLLFCLIWGSNGHFYVFLVSLGWGGLIACRILWR